MSDQLSLPPFLLEQTFVAFDTETTGLWAPVNNIVEIGAARFRIGQKQVETFQSLVKPGRPIPPDVIGIHGITDAMVADAPDTRSALERFASFCGSDSILIAHNAPFDISFVGCELDRVGLIFGDNSILDTVEIMHSGFPGLPSYSLAHLISHFKIADIQEHRALGDAQCVRCLFQIAVQKWQDVTSFEKLKETTIVHSMAEWTGEAVELPEQFADIELAIRDRISLVILYEAPDLSRQERVIHPRRLHSKGARVYLTAFCEVARAERTFRLDRIVQFRLNQA